MPKIYLLSRTLDPILGIFTGLLAYKLHETNPRSAPAEGHTLGALLGWRWQLSKDRRAERERLELGGDAGESAAGSASAAAAGVSGAGSVPASGSGAKGSVIQALGAAGQGPAQAPATGKSGGEDEMWEKMRRELEADGREQSVGGGKGLPRK